MDILLGARMDICLPCVIFSVMRNALPSGMRMIVVALALFFVIGITSSDPGMGAFVCASYQAKDAGAADAKMM